MERVHLKPKEGLLVRDEKTKQILPVEGRIVEMSTYWVRRLKDGDVVLVENAKIAEAAKSSEVKKAKKEGDK